jgi:hypothetical protein
VRGGAALLVTFAFAVPASADDSVVAQAPRPSHPHTIYVELLGKAGLWGLGYDAQIRPKLAVGATASFLAHDDERQVIVSPYVALYPIGTRHRWFVEAGPQVVHLRQMSPVPEWPGQRETGLGAELGSGYEFRGRVVFRAYAMGTVGKQGIAPWLGVSMGVAL